MKGLFRKTGRGAKRAVAYGELKDNTNYIIRTIKGFWRVGGEKAKAYQSFDELPFSASEIKQSQENFKKLAITYFAIFVFSVFYIIYNLFYANYVTTILSVCFSFACLSMAFRYHFWFFQIKVRRLGCSLREYLGYLLSKEA